jgi:hypothetical protein
MWWQFRVAEDPCVAARFSSAHPGVGNPRGRHVVDVVRVVDATTWKGRRHLPKPVRANVLVRERGGKRL